MEFINAPRNLVSAIDKPSVTALIEETPFKLARFAGYLDDRSEEVRNSIQRGTERAPRSAVVGRLRPFAAFALVQRYNVTGMHGMSLRW
jgi:hypothetical protein